MALRIRNGGTKIFDTISFFRFAGALQSEITTRKAGSLAGTERGLLAVKRPIRISNFWALTARSLIGKSWKTLEIVEFWPGLSRWRVTKRIKGFCVGFAPQKPLIRFGAGRRVFRIQVFRLEGDAIISNRIDIGTAKILHQLPAVESTSSRISNKCVENQRLGTDCGSGGRWFESTQLYQGLSAFLRDGCQFRRHGLHNWTFCRRAKVPWKEGNHVVERLKFIARLLDGEKMAVLCCQFGISRKTGYRILVGTRLTRLFSKLRTNWSMALKA